jgi:hypothetical protein
MKTRLFLFCGLLLVPMGILCQAKPATKVIIYARTQPPSPRSEAEAAAVVFQGEVLQALMEKYPCIEALTASQAEDLVGWKRSMDLMGADQDSDFADHAAGGLGAKYAITLTVSQLSTGQFLLGASIKPGFRPDPQAGGGELVGGSTEAVLAGITAKAKKFAGSLSGQFKEFTKEYCDPTNLWTGTITFRRTQQHEDKSERQAISGEGTVTSTATRTLNHDVTITLPWTGLPRASIAANESRRFEELAVAKINCGGVGIARKGVWKSAGWNHLTRMNRYASASGEAKVSVIIAKDSYEIKVSLPNIEGTEESTKIEHSDGGCGKPSDNTAAPFKERWSAKVDLLKIKAPLRKPDELQGSDSDDLGGIISWNLARTPMKK